MNFNLGRHRYDVYVYAPKNLNEGPSWSKFLSNINRKHALRTVSLFPFVEICRGDGTVEYYEHGVKVDGKKINYRRD